MKSRSFSVLARGPIAVFTRPEMKVERVSYEVMTPSAARGMLEAVLWKPAIRWCVESIAVLNPVRWTAFRRNEVNSKASARGGSFYADEDRAQRNTVALKDVAYVVRAHFLMTDRAGADDSVAKFEAMFERRLEKGQAFHQPYLGCREFAAEVSPAPAAFTPIDAHVARPLGLMFYDFDYRTAPPKPMFFDARLDGGVLQIPTSEEVMRQNGGAA